MVKKIIITVHSRKADVVSPSATLFQVEVENDDGVQERSFGDVGKLNAFFDGMRVATITAGEGYLTNFSLDISSDWTEPRGIRWTFEDGMSTKREDLDSEGNIIQI